MKTCSLYLDPDSWDLALDDSNNLAIVSNPYACAQDVATACSTFRGECIYQNDIGIPFNERILGHNPGMGSVRTWLENEALRLPYIKSASVTVISDITRTATGLIAVVDKNGIESTLTL